MLGKEEPKEALFAGMTKRLRQPYDKGELYRDFRVDEEAGMPSDPKLEELN